MTPQQKIASLEARIAQLQTRLAGQTKVATGVDAEIAEIKKALAIAKPMYDEAERFHDKYSDLMMSFSDKVAHMEVLADKLSDQDEDGYSQAYADAEQYHKKHVFMRHKGEPSGFTYDKSIAFAAVVSVEMNKVSRTKWSDETNLAYSLEQHARSGMPALDGLGILIQTCENIIKSIEALTKA